MIKQYKILFCILAVMPCFVSCKKTPGEGGNAQIKGQYWSRNYDPFFSYVTGRYPAMNETVYLFFGDDASPGTSTKTDENGNFEFKYLRKGKYRVVVYGNQKPDATSASSYALTHNVTIAKRKDMIDIGLDTITK